MGTQSIVVPPPPPPRFLSSFHWLAQGDGCMLFFGGGAHGWVAKSCQPWEWSPSPACRSWLPVVQWKLLDISGTLVSLHSIVVKSLVTALTVRLLDRFFFFMPWRSHGWRTAKNYNNIIVTIINIIIIIFLVALINSQEYWLFHHRHIENNIIFSYCDLLDVLFLSYRKYTFFLRFPQHTKGW